jgi:hypothetical protein
MDHLVHEPGLLRLLRADVLAGEDHVERHLQADNAWQPLRAADAGNEPELRLRKCEHCLGMIGRDAIPAREGEFESATHAGAVNGTDERNAKPLHSLEPLLAFGTRALRHLGGRKGQELVDVGAGDERVLLSADQHHTPDAHVALEGVEDLVELADDAVRELVDRLAAQVKGDDRDAVVHFQAKGATDHARSTTIAKPSPPAAQTVINPNCPFRRFSSFTSVVVMRAPVAPKGWPIAIDPPATFRIDRSTRPRGAPMPARSAHSLDSNPFRFESTCAANASCISRTSM